MRIYGTNYQKQIDLLKDVKAVDNSNEVIDISILYKKDLEEKYYGKY